MEKPSLILLIGLPGSGKSSWAEKYKKEHENVNVVSSDKIREVVFGDVNDQTQNEEVFKIINIGVKEQLRNGFSVIVDATHLFRRRRINFLKQYSDYERKAVVFAIPFEVCCKRNLNRERVVPAYVMKKMYQRFQPPHYVEGFDSIEIVSDSDITPDYLAGIEEKNMATAHDNPHHSLSCGAHCDAAANYIREHYKDRKDLAQLYHAAKYHDLSKYKCKIMDAYDMKLQPMAHFYNHEKVSAYDYLCALNHLDAQFRIEVANLIEQHMVFYAGENAVEKTRKLFGEEFFDRLKIVHEADMAAH